MYAGRIVETGSVTDVFERPTHPYTEGLLASIPSLDVEQDRLAVDSGHGARARSRCRRAAASRRAARHARPPCDAGRAAADRAAATAHAVACIRPVGYRVGALAP